MTTPEDCPFEKDLPPIDPHAIISLLREENQRLLRENDQLKKQELGRTRKLEDLRRAFDEYKRKNIAKQQDQEPLDTRLIQSSIN